MATRDLTDTFVRTRAALNRRRPGEGGASAAGGGGGGGEIAGLAAVRAPVYVERVTEINDGIATIAAKMAELRKIQAERLKVSYDASGEREQDEAIGVMTAEITTLFNRNKGKIEALDRYQSAAPEQEELRLFLNIKRGLATRLQDLSLEFRALQKSYLGRLQNMRESSSIERLIGMDTGAAAPETDTGFTDEQIAAVVDMETDVDERMREIQRIARSVSELAAMFRELSTLIVEQGTILDRIDHNMEEAVTRVQAGKANLEQAEKYQKSARPITCMAVLMVLIVICVIIIIVKGSQAKS